ncbi:MAG: peptidase T, partial [Sphaerochaeta sp.]|nr:peptidase T [Sphaerochaeta sp.]
MSTSLKNEILSRFLRYAVIDTMSDDQAVAVKHPSTDGQWDLLNLLVDELKAMGISDIQVDPNGVVIARLASNIDHPVPTVAFMAHVDTADDVMGNNVKPRVIDSYDGKDIVLNEQYTLVAEENPELAKYVGETIIVTDGNTLLGSDDKAGVAEIMSAAAYLKAHPEVKHGVVEFIFT